jgi:hypothetical protein
MNEIIRNFDHMPFQNIVYMGAASTIKDYETAIFPYLRKKNLSLKGEKIRPPVKVYHLILHEAAESAEANYWDLPIRGSLLVWIDNFLSNPLKNQDRTVGRFVNLMSAVHHTPKGLKQFIHIHKFPTGVSIDSSSGDTQEINSPQEHGAFSYFKFWKPKCWMSTEDGKSNGCFSGS